MHSLAAFGIIIAKRAISVAALVIGEQVGKADGDLGPLTIFLIPPARNAQHGGHRRVARPVELDSAMAGGRMEDHPIGIDFARLSHAPGRGKPLANLTAPKRSKLRSEESSVGKEGVSKVRY